MKIKIFGSRSLIKNLFKSSEETPEQFFDKAQALFQKGNTREGYIFLQASALKGHAEAAFQMGSAIFENKTFGSMKDAVKYLTIASDKGHAFATTNLATCYQMGKGTDVDHVKAIHLLNKAIKLGDEMATFNLAQTYLLGVGVKRDAQKGWGMLESLASKGNKQARQYMDDMLRKGYDLPQNEEKPCTTSKSQGPEWAEKFGTDNAPDCNIADKHVLSLYDSAKNGDESAKMELMELGGNRMNREAMNALRKLGLITENVSDDFKRGTIEYIATVWKTYNVEPLYVVCVWTYPGFIYREYKDDKVLFETKSEDVFIERMSKELSRCTKERIVPKFRLREVNNSSSYCVDVLLQGIHYQVSI